VTRVVLTREEGRNASLRDYLPSGVHVVEVPATRTEFRDLGAFEEALRGVTSATGPSWLVVTSARSARYARRTLEVLGVDARVASVGAVTTGELEGLGVAVALRGDAGAAALAPSLSGTVITIGALENRGELEEILVERGVTVHHVACYETRACALSARERRTLADADVVFVGAPSSWRVVGAFVSERALLVVPGATTAEHVGARHEVMVGWDESLPARLGTWISSHERTLGEA